MLILMGYIKIEKLKEEKKRGHGDGQKNNCTVSLPCAVSSNLPQSLDLKEKLDPVWRMKGGLRCCVTQVGSL